ncbi:CLK4-associating serine/arginine rich protein isoform X1 [Tyto alba]|uniref:CLK4-associating serine/arginine rich protein isoform X1 n=1 Tax=Tyto alba TaxID=56313 RepID=UPI001C66EABB|nr:CLK4-associating serine/arginine rich protein isoform X1 [Tyto alba]XP_042653206.1 CLK4-associating serine/arginine rich protein isoform X1 [Tyto alba]XP_042653207.1 CLK4-associating serine/arginine rich protein isoform X1 [Tyto alba]XP_042653208.1 CLK4-associating serine/arginine rich protein isoform X1 [Tyto alba]
MWHEARKHERKLRGMMVDYKKRAERRREYYEKIKKDPAQFLQVHGRACKVHLDSAVALAAESPVNMMPWQGDTNNMIDRFDVRAHLDYIPMYTPPLLNPISPEQESDERKCNYERYRGLVQNDFAGISEEQCLYQIYIDELYGGLQKPNEDEKKKLAEKKASIGYTYEDSTVAELENSLEKRGDEEDSEEDSNTDEDEVIPDIDVEVDVDELNQEQVADLNKQATTYGMAEGDFVRMLRKDKEEAEAIKNAKALEEEKAMYSGRRSRRQRREFREKRLKGRKISPPSYARRDSPTYDPYKRSPSESTSESRSRSRTPSPGHEEKITFITSFGGSDEEAAAASAQTPGGPGKTATLSKQRSTPGQPGSTAAGHSSSSRSVTFPIRLVFSSLTRRDTLPRPGRGERGGREPPHHLTPRAVCLHPPPRGYLRAIVETGAGWGTGICALKLRKCLPAPGRSGVAHVLAQLGVLGGLAEPRGVMPCRGDGPFPTPPVCQRSHVSLPGDVPHLPPPPRPPPRPPARAPAPARTAAAVTTAPAATAAPAAAATRAPAAAAAATQAGGARGTAAAAPDPIPPTGDIATAPAAAPGAVPGLGSVTGEAAGPADTGAAAGAAGAPVTRAAAASRCLRCARNRRDLQHRPPWGRN